MSGISFEAGNPRAAAVAARLTDTFIETFGETTGLLIQPIIIGALLAGHGIRKVAVPLREIIGSPPRQKASIERYRRHLESGSIRALRHPLRDRRADKAVSKAIASKPIPSERLSNLCSAMDARMTAVRAEAIAAEAMLLCISVANHEHQIENIRRIGVDPRRVRKTWMSCKDERDTPTERELDGQTVAFSEPFLTISGVRIQFPGDPKAPRHTRRGCRSVMTIRTFS